jgi:hypothetical protein
VGGCDGWSPGWSSRRSRLRRRRLRASVRLADPTGDRQRRAGRDEPFRPRDHDRLENWTSLGKLLATIPAAGAQRAIAFTNGTG